MFDAARGYSRWPGAELGSCSSRSCYSAHGAAWGRPRYWPCALVCSLSSVCSRFGVSRRDQPGRLRADPQRPRGAERRASGGDPLPMEAGSFGRPGSATSRADPQLRPSACNISCRRGPPERLISWKLEQLLQLRSVPLWDRCVTVSMTLRDSYAPVGPPSHRVQNGQSRQAIGSDSVPDLADSGTELDPITGAGAGVDASVGGRPRHRAGDTVGP